MLGMSVPGVQYDQKRTSDPLELELQAVVKGSGNQTCVLRRSGHCS